MQALKIIDDRQVLNKSFRIYGDFDNPLFLAKDVAEWIEHSNSTKMLEGVDEDEKVVVKTPTNNSLVGLQSNTNYTFLTENGLYEVLMQSRKPIAKAFKKEVKEILKSVRKHGMYAIDKILDNPDMAIAALTRLKEEREKRKVLEVENKIQQQQILELKPKADYTDRILQSKSLVTISQIAKDYGMSGAEMNKRLHKLGIQYKQSGQWLLYRQYQDKGYTHSETVEIKHSDGQTGITMNTKWTQKGRLFLYKLLKENDILPMIEREI